MRNDAIIFEYKDMGSSGIDDVVFAVPFKPTPEKVNYDSGFLDRYFVQKINTLDITEVSNEVYTQCLPQIYSKAKVKWKITGNKNNIYKNNVLQYVGVEEYNKSQVKEISKSLFNFDKYIKNYTEFWKG